MRTPLNQALHDAQAVSEWMDDNHAHDESVGFATAWAEILSVIRYLSGTQQSGQGDAFCPGHAAPVVNGFCFECGLPRYK